MQRIIITKVLFYFSMYLPFFILMACQPASTQGNTTSDTKSPAVSIHEAAFMGNVKAIKQHLAASTNLDEKDEYGSTPLNIAATFGKVEIAKLLIEGGAGLGIRSNDGSTALHTAAFFCRTEIVKSLLKAGADRELKNNFGSTPLATAEIPFEQIKPVYDQISKDLGPLGLKLDYKKLEETRPLIAELLKNHQ